MEMCQQFPPGTHPTGPGALAAIRSFGPQSPCILPPGSARPRRCQYSSVIVFSIARRARSMAYRGVSGNETRCLCDAPFSEEQRLLRALPEYQMLEMWDLGCEFPFDGGRAPPGQSSRTLRNSSATRAFAGGRGSPRGMPRQRTLFCINRKSLERVSSGTRSSW